MWDFDLSDALGAMARTAPFIALRVVVYAGISALYIVVTGVSGAIGFFLTSFAGGQGSGGVYGGLLGFGAVSGLLYLGREYILYLVKAGHVAVLVEVMDGRELPTGKGQIEYGADIVKKRFAESSVLFAIDQTVKAVLRTMTRVLNTVSMVLPIPGLRNLAQLISAILRMSVTYVDEIILADILRTRTANPWGSGRRALVLYAQNYLVMVKNAAWLWLLMWAATLVIFFVTLAPVAGLIALFPGNIGFLSFVLAFIFAWSLKAALLEPLAIYALMQVYFRTVEGQTPDREWQRRLEQASDQFREMSQKAREVFSAPRREADRAGP